MTKEQQIGTMTKIIDEYFEVYTSTPKDIAENLFEEGCRIVEQDENIKHTNRDWLFSLPNTDLTMLILEGLAHFSKQSTSSQCFIEEWLDKEYDEVYAKMAFPYLECWRK